jgi:hypothetical protein
MPPDTAGGLPKIRISIDREDTTALARISTITTDRNTLTQEHP